MRLTVVTVPSDDTELAADRLWAAGAGAVEELAVDDGLVQLRTVLASDDTTSVARLGTLPAAWQVSFVDADETPSEAWRDHARAIVVNDELTVRPAWLAGDPGTDTSDRTCIVTIEPAGSFGLGDHPTTRLSCHAAWTRTRAGMRVLDVGCGSGVLAIVALLRGAGHAVAIDVAEAAREATISNARRNGVGERIDVSCDPLAAVDGRFDLVLANILAPTLIELADDIRRVMAPGGRLVISGVLADHHQHVIEALAPLRVDGVNTLDAWACIELVSPDD